MGEARVAQREGAWFSLSLRGLRSQDSGVESSQYRCGPAGDLIEAPQAYTCRTFCPPYLTIKATQFRALSKWLMPLNYWIEYQERGRNLDPHTAQASCFIHVLQDIILQIQVAVIEDIFGLMLLAVAAKLVFCFFFCFVCLCTWNYLVHLFIYVKKMKTTSPTLIKSIRDDQFSPKFCTSSAN